jgi:hypothetical protein
LGERVGLHSSTPESVLRDFLIASPNGLNKSKMLLCRHTLTQRMH